MGDLEEFPLRWRLFLRSYPWRRIDPVPWSELEKPLAAARVALVSSAGLVLPGQAPFDEGVRGGDWSFREIPAETAVSSLIETHRSQLFDHSGIAADRNLAFPLDRLRELAAAGFLGEVAPRHFSLMGSLTAVGRFQRGTGPEIARRLAADRVDATLLVPV